MPRLIVTLENANTGNDIVLDEWVEQDDADILAGMEPWSGKWFDFVMNLISEQLQMTVEVKPDK